MLSAETIERRAEGIEVGTWSHAVACLLGPRQLSDPEQLRHQQAVQIAVAALQLAGRSDLAALVQAECL